MNPLSYKSLRMAGLACLVLAAGAAQAHTGHGTSGVMEGLAHPFGMDHLLAMVAVGVWSVSALPETKAWWGPATFMLSLIASAALGAMGVTVPFLEHMIALSVALFGVMLIFSRQKMPTSLGLGMIALAASFHGLAHGAEAPASGFIAYAVGFLVTTAALHFGGVLAGLSIRRHLASKAAWALTAMGSACGAAGLYLFSQV